MPLIVVLTAGNEQQAWDAPAAWPSLQVPSCAQGQLGAEQPSGVDLQTTAVFDREGSATVKPEESRLVLVYVGIKPSESMTVLSWNDGQSQESHLNYKRTWVSSSYIVITRQTHYVFPVEAHLWSFPIQLALRIVLAFDKRGETAVRAVPVWASAGALWHCFPRLMMEEWTFAFSIPSEVICAASSVLWYSASWGREEPFINISGNTVSTFTCFAHSFSVSQNLSDQNCFTLFY